METSARNVNTELNTPLEDSNNPKEKKVYTRPRLEDYGRLENVTLGGSPGIGDSGSSGTQQLL